jgi:hypothetical protein
MRVRFLLPAVAAIAAVVPFGPGATFSGQLSSALLEVGGQGDWVNQGSTTIAWEVTDMTTHFHYKYTLTVPQTTNEISHFLIEVSPNFGMGDFWNESGPFQATEIGNYDQSNGNPSIPEAVHGLKFDEMSGTTAIIEFDTLRVPVWGDWYAKCGGNPPNEAWNMGIDSPDPLAPAANGSINNHILVPDSVVPEPATLSLMALAGLILRRRL